MKAISSYRCNDARESVPANVDGTPERPQAVANESLQGPQAYVSQLTDVSRMNMDGPAKSAEPGDTNLSAIAGRPAVRPARDSA